jgi:hypothetical protein
MEKTFDMGGRFCLEKPENKDSVEFYEEQVPMNETKKIERNQNKSKQFLTIVIKKLSQTAHCCLGSKAFYHLRKKNCIA